MFKNYCKDFLRKKSASSKTVFMVGDLNINSFDYDNNALVKNFFNLFFHSGFLPLIQRATRVTRTTMKCKIGQIFALMKPTVLF